MAGRTTNRKSGKRRSPVKRLVVLSLGLAVLAVAGFVSIAGTPGWLTPEELTNPPAQGATVATDVLNVRQGPTTDAAILDSYPEGASVQVVGDPEAGFVPIRYGDGQAWMAAEYLAFDHSPRSLAANPLEVAEVSAAEPVADENREEPADTAPPEPELEPMAVEDAPAAAPALDAGPAERWIDVDRTTATVTLYEGGTAVAAFTGRIGRDRSTDGFYATAVGTFHVYSMNEGLAPTPFADDTYLTDWVGFDPERKNGIHSPVRDEFGNEKAWQNPATLGCVRLEAEAAVAVFDFAEIGMRVEVHD